MSAIRALKSKQNPKPKTKSKDKAKNKPNGESSKSNDKSNVKMTIALLKHHYPDAHCELDHSNAYELLIATILSAQCTDKRVNQVTPNLFAHFPTPKALSQATQEEVETLVRSTGFYKNKAKNLIACCQKLVDTFDGEIPKTVDELTSLAGVGRKTANVVLGNVFGISVGIVVDTHVTRLARRLGWTSAKEPLQIELDLQKIINAEDWILISHLLIWHGRRVCRARNPSCETCFLFDRCPKKAV